MYLIKTGMVGLILSVSTIAMAEPDSNYIYLKTIVIEPKQTGSLQLDTLNDGVNYEVSCLLHALAYQGSYPTYVVINGGSDSAKTILLIDGKEMPRNTIIKYDPHGSVFQLSNVHKQDGLIVFTNQDNKEYLTVSSCIAKVENN